MDRSSRDRSPALDSMMTRNDKAKPNILPRDVSAPVCRSSMNNFLHDFVPYINVQMFIIIISTPRRSDPQVNMISSLLLTKCGWYWSDRRCSASLCMLNFLRQEGSVSAELRLDHAPLTRHRTRNIFLLHIMLSRLPGRP